MPEEDSIIESPELEYDSDIIDGSPEYSPKSELSKPRQVDTALARCVDARGQEMKAGYWNTKFTKDKTPIRVWIPDARKIYIARVQALKCLLNPEINRDEKYKLFLSGVKERERRIFDKYAYEDKVIDFVYDSVLMQRRPILKPNGEKYMPDIDEIVTVKDPTNPTKAMTQPKLWNSKVNAYYDEMVLLYDDIFSNLNDLIDRLNYFKMVLNYG